MSGAFFCRFLGISLEGARQGMKLHAALDVS
jgi:hypothetical protein